jgi:molybdopterin-guanine dinucleotide biosynthesis protein A
MTHERPLAAAILAGGQARRLGGLDKKSLAIGGPSILERQLAALRRVADPVFVVGGSRALAPPALRHVPDAIAGAGALGGIYTAIVESPHDRTLVVACDMPFLAPALLARMAAEDADVVIPRGERGYEPLCAIYTKACAAGMRARIERGQLQASLLPVGVRVVELGRDVIDAYDPDGFAFVNINTPHDYARARNLADRITEEN